MILRLSFLIISALALSVTNASVREFASSSEAFDYYKCYDKNRMNIEANGGNCMRGGGRYTETTTYETRWYTANTYEYVGSTFSWSQYSRNTCGTVVPYPASDFCIQDAFTFKDQSRSTTEKYDGLLVAVEIGISSTSHVSWNGRLRAMKNLVESGGNYKDNIGKTVRLRPIGKVVRERFGCLNLKTFYWGDEYSGGVGFVLFDCKPEKANKNLHAAEIL